MLPGPTIPSTSTIEQYETSYIAGKLYTITMQSRDTFGAILDNDENNYEIDFSRSDGVSPGQFFVTPVYQQLGFYYA